jgi:hypothetical protein
MQATSLLLVVKLEPNPSRTLSVCERGTFRISMMIHEAATESSEREKTIQKYFRRLDRLD